MAECTGGKGPCRFDCADQRQAPPDARNHQPGEEITETGQGDGQALGRVATDAVGAEEHGSEEAQARVVERAAGNDQMRGGGDVGGLVRGVEIGQRADFLPGEPGFGVSMSVSGSSRSRIIPAMASGPWRPGSSSPITGLQC